MNQSENSQFLGTEKISKLILKFSVPCVSASFLWDRGYLVCCTDCRFYCYDRGGGFDSDIYAIVKRSTI